MLLKVLVGHSDNTVVSVLVNVRFQTTEIEVMIFTLCVFVIGYSLGQHS